MLYIFEISLHQASRWLRNLINTSGMRVNMSSPLARHTFKPVEVGSTTILTGVLMLPSLCTARQG
jgi:hypothetical protein